MRAIDTNVLVRLLTQDDEKQLELAKAFVGRGAWVSQLVLVEALWVLDSVYERTPAQLASAVGMLLQHESLVVQDSDTVAVALERFRQAPKIGFSDCLILEVARRAGHLPLGTFDRHLAKLPEAERLR